ncbi:MAG: HIT domain-containing protein [Actinomycetota bacterium]
MVVKSGCVFCEIVAGADSRTLVVENELAVAFMDIDPVTPGHVLVIPRSHSVDLFDIGSEDLAACTQLARVVARRAKNRLDADGVNLLNCSGEAAWQSVFHFHLHVIVRFSDEPEKDRIGLPWESVPSTLEEIERIANLLR